MFDVHSRKRTVKRSDRDVLEKKLPGTRKKLKAGRIFPIDAIGIVTIMVSITSGIAIGIPDRQEAAKEKTMKTGFGTAGRSSILGSVWGIVSLIVACAVITAHAQEEEETQSLLDAITGGTPSVNARLRYEHAESDAADDADALTLRTRLGYSTAPFHGLRGFIEFENVTSIGDDDRYNQAGTNPGGSNRTVIADVEGTEVNQAYLEMICPATDITVIGGRQRIILGNARFIGNVGWRQNEQTYDGVLAKSGNYGGLELLYGYVSGVNRIFGQENGTEPSGAAPNAATYDADSHLVNVSYSPCKGFASTAYAYLLDLGDGAVGAANSSDTYGINCVVSYDNEDGLGGAAELEYARQSDNSATTATADYSANYIKADVSGKMGIVGAGVGYELLGSDNGAAFRTPLATGHKFNGWADVFLTAPADGLQDLYAYASVKCPKGIGPTVKVVYHSFESDAGSIDYGNELDVVAVQKLGERFTLIAKYANYSADSDPVNPRPNDVERFSIEAGFTF